MNYAPENELGVVFLFSRLARKVGLEIDLIRPGYPDCIAYRDGKRIRIEFEYRSSNFARRRHEANDCDWIVCWIYDWPAVPSRLHVWSLQQEFGLGFNVGPSQSGSRTTRYWTRRSSARLGASLHRPMTAIWFFSIEPPPRSSSATSSASPARSNMSKRGGSRARTGWLQFAGSVR